MKIKDTRNIRIENIYLMEINILKIFGNVCIKSIKRCYPPADGGKEPLYCRGVSQEAAGPELCLTHREYQLVQTNNRKDYFSDFSRKFCTRNVKTTLQTCLKTFAREIY